MSSKTTAKKNIEDIYPLSPMQQGMLFHALLEPQSPAYNEQLYFKIEGALDTSLFGDVISSLLQRHPVLRTSFIYKKSEKLLQVVHKKVELPLTVHDWRERSAQQQEQDFQRELQDQRTNLFDLSRAPLIRFTLIQTGDEAYYLLISNHHIILDGWSVPILLRELFMLYEARKKGIETPLPPSAPFKSYIAWLQKQDKQLAQQFWKEQMHGFNAATPLAFRESHAREGGYQNIRFTLDEAKTANMEQLAKNNRVTLNTVVQAAWAVLLSKYCGENDVLFGATVSGRPPEIPAVEKMVGLFINTLPLRVKINPAQPVSGLLEDISKTGTAMREFEYTPLVDIQRLSDLRGQEALFDSILVFENYPVEESMSESNMPLQVSDFGSYERTNFPLTVAFSARGKMHVEFAFQTPLFSESGLTLIFERLCYILEQFVSDPQQPIKELRLAKATEEKRVLKEFAHGQGYPIKQTIIDHIHDVFAENAAEVAIYHDKGEDVPAREMTYEYLERATHWIAHFLLKKGIKREQRVGVLLSTSVDQVAVPLGIMLAGAVYLPIDVNYPDDRIHYILNDAQLDYVICHAKYKSLVSKVAHVIVLDELYDTIHKQPGYKPGVDVDLDNLAYMIYTSGSTGRPKGTMLTHGGLMNLVKGQADTFGYHHHDIVLQFASTSFDASISEIFGALHVGGELVLADTERKAAGPQLTGLLNRHKVKIATLPPSVVSLMRGEELPYLQSIVTAGEACPPEMARHWYDKVHFVNGYGPTEFTVCSTTYHVQEDDFTDHVPIGKAIVNTQTYILDENLRPVPIGVAGELHVAGKSLARGYFNRPALTAERFIPHPFSEKGGERLYKTGDLCRYRADGNIEFLGRIDTQVKLRGYRIELGEIEAVFSDHPDITNCAVIKREDIPGNAYLAAYITGDVQQDTNKLKEFLKVRLPDYMIPTAFVFMDSLPLTTNGKIDRKALPKPQMESSEAEYLAPRNATEELLADMYKDILGLAKAGVNDDFFEAGGHSLSATRLVTRIRNTFSVELPMREVFNNATIAKLALAIEREKRGTGSVLPAITKAARTADLPVSLPQKRLWFIDQFSPGNTAYNIPFAVKISGKPDASLLEKSFKQTIARHETLRTHFINKDGEPFQVIEEKVDFTLESQDLGALNEGEQKEQVEKSLQELNNHSFDLSTLPLFRARLIRLADDSYILGCVMHHIISDGWSMTLLVRELAEHYRASVEEQQARLPELQVQYADFSIWQNEWLRGELLEKQLQFWKNYIGLNPPVLELHGDFQRPAVQSFNGRNHDFEFSPQLAAQLEAFCKKQGVTLFMALLATWQTLLQRYSGQQQVIVGSPVSGRHHSHTENLIGFFVNTILVKADFSDKPSYKKLLQQTREDVLNVYANQDVPFEQLVEVLQPDRDLAHPPLFQAAFILQNRSNQKIETGLLDIEPVETENAVAKVDLSLYVAETENGILGRLEYNADIFSAATIARMQKHLLNLLETALQNPDLPTAHLPLLTAPEEQQLLVEWNDSNVEFNREQLVHRRFEEWAAKSPARPALAFAGEERSYQTVNKNANLLARRLQKKGCGPESIVGICLDRSFEMVEAMLAILKTGAAYLPLDPGYPQERLHYMITDSGARVVVTEDAFAAKLEQDLAELVIVSHDNATSDDSNLNVPMDAAGIAYLIYTSGSTGKPKGTMLAHRGAINLANAQKKAFEITPESRVLQFASLSFDAATWETLMALMNGATLHLVPREILASGEALVKTLNEDQITTITLPPSVLAVWPKDELAALKTIITAGEKCSAELVKTWQPGRRFVNAYGPTETTVCCAMYETRATEKSDPPIGRNLPNFDLYILDADLQPVPQGVPGELCVGGVGLARGYLRRPALTAEKFIPHPWSKNSGERLYRTGDLVRRLEDGNIEFLGRIDQQVKLRGFRIELGEIENAIREKEPAAKDVFVMVREDNPGEQKLAAYLVAEGECDVSALRSGLADVLPDYMVPAAFVVLDAMPLTPNGKIDRKSLPAPAMDRSQLSREFVEPRNETEKTVAAIIGTLLDVERVGVHDNFFELGGHSLLATKFVSRVRDELGLELPLRALFENPTVEGVAMALAGPDARKVDDDEAEIVAAERADDEDLDTLLGELEGLSDDDVKAMLEDSDDDEEREDD